MKSDVDGVRYEAYSGKWGVTYQGKQIAKFKNKLDAENCRINHNNKIGWVDTSKLSTEEIIDKVFRYSDGKVFIEKPNNIRKWTVGKEVGTKNLNGYIMVNINRKSHSLSAIVWYMHKKVWSKLFMGHINHIRDDNRIENLREVTPKENSKNMAMHSDNALGLACIGYIKGLNKYRVQVRNGETGEGYRGVYSTIEEAITVRDLYWEDLGYHENHGVNLTLKEPDFSDIL